MIRTSILLIALIGDAMFCVSGWAQSGTSDSDAARVISPTRGFQPAHSYALSDIESIDEASGALSFHIPLAQLPPGPAGFTAGVKLSYSSKYWETEPNVGSTTSYVLKQSTAGGWRVAMAPVLERETLSNRDLTDPCGPSGAADLFQMRVINPDGSRHTFLLSSPSITMSTLCEPGTYTMSGLTNASTGPETWYTIDGSYLRLVIDNSPSSSDVNTWPDDVSWTLYRPDGTSVRHVDPTTTYLKDRNGNAITIVNSISGGHAYHVMSDPFGRNITIDHDTSANTDTITQSLQDDDGKAQPDLKWVIQYTSIPPSGSTFPSYQCVPPPQSFTCSIQSALVVVSTLQLPDGLKYSFDYSTSRFGEVNTMTLPTGASVAYTYRMDTGGGHCGLACYFDVLSNTIASKVVTHDGTTDPAWTYNYSVSNTGAVLGSTISAPDGGSTAYSFVEIDYQFASWPGAGAITQINYPDKSIVQREWAENKPHEAPLNAQSTNQFIQRELTTTASAAGSPTATSIRVFTADKNGNITSEEERGWLPYSQKTPASSDAALLRKTVTTYVSAAADSSSTAPDTNAYSNPSFVPAQLDLVASSEVQSGSSTVVSRSTFNYQETTPSRMVGNLVAKLTWDSTKAAPILPGAVLTSGLGGNAIAWRYTYTPNGNLQTERDPNNNTTTYTYGPVATTNTCPNNPSSTSDLYRTAMTRGGNSSQAQNWSFTYNCWSGQTHSLTDPSNLTTTIWHDSYNRPTTITDGGLRKTVHSYNDSSRWIVTQNDVAAYNDQRNVSVLYYDQLGRIRLQRQLETTVVDPTTAATDETSGIKTQTSYHLSSGHNETWVSNPYVDSTSPQGWTVSRRDTLGRVCVTEWFAGSSNPSVASGCTASTGTTGAATQTFDATVNWTSSKLTDAAGAQRILYQNALGQMIAAVEDPAGKKYASYYGYDLLNDLQSVRQAGTCTNPDPVGTPCGGGLSRSFTYSSLKRLISAQNPESGTIGYSFDDAGNLIQRQHGSLMVQNGYDDLNRLISQTYNDSTPPVTYTYDTAASAQMPAGCAAFDGATGRLASVGNSVSTSYYFYNKLGLPQCYRQSTANVPYDSWYKTTPQGDWNQVVYPSGRTLNLTFNDRGLPTSVGSYATGATYWPHGGLNQVNLGNTLKEQTCYNSRLQISGLRAGTAAFNTDCSNQAGDLLALSYDYGSTNNNGNLQNQKINVPWSDGSGIHTQTMTQSYGYDTLNRINYAGETVNGLPSGVNPASWSWNFDADQYGNASGTNNLGLTAPLMPASSAYFDTATNRLSKYGASPGTALQNDAYDAAGNLQHHPELCQNASNTPCMQYDGEGRLMQVTNGGNVARYDYDGEGRRVRKTETAGNPVTTVYVHDAGGNLIAEYAQGGTTETGSRYLTADHLGSTRLVTDGSGVVVQRLDYFPFGQAIPAGESDGNRNSSRIPGYGATSTLTLQFTGKERGDSVAEGGLDYFGARYFSGAQGRFTSPDAPFADQHPEDPQSWNMYAYVRNNPLKNTDPDGRDCQNGIAACGNYILGGAGAVFNAFTAGIINAPTHIVNAAVSPFTDYRFQEPVQPLYTPANAEQSQGAQSANAVMLVAPVAEAGATALVDALGTGAKVEAGTTAVQTGVQANKAVGDAFRDEVASGLAKEGRGVQTEVTKTTPFGTRRIDIEVSDKPGGKVLGGVETKTGNSPYKPAQRAKDEYLKQQGYPVNVVRKKPEGQQ